jgi:abelson tyrosine-protein kinase 1
MPSSPARSGVVSPESAVRVSSPLNPSSSPASSSGTTPTKSPPVPLPVQGRPRGHSTSTINQNTSAASSSTLANPLSRVTSAPAVHVSPSLTVSDYDYDDLPRSSFRDRSRSSFGSRSRSPVTKLPKGAETPPNGPPSSWWGGNNDLIPRPWRDPPRKKMTVPPEQTEGWVNTRQVIDPFYFGFLPRPPSPN